MSDLKHRSAAVKLCRAVSVRRRPLLWSLVSVVFVLTAGYFVDSLPYSFGGEMSVPQLIERARFAAVGGQDNLPDSVLLVNVAYDKSLVDYSARLSSDTCDTRRMPAGRIAVTDRRKLYDFLRILSGSDYRYVMLDVRFEDDITEDADTRRLFALIADMDRIVFAKHENTTIAPGAPAAKAAYSDYHTTVAETNMAKYPLLKCGGLSIPARMHSELHGADFSTIGWLSFDGVALCRRSVFVTYPVRVSEWVSEQNGGNPLGVVAYQYYNLGKNLLEMPDSAALIKKLARDRIVVVGDFVDDIHETYVGTMAGPLINLNAFIALSHGLHKIQIIPTLLLIAVYFIMSYFIIARASIFRWLPPVLRRRRPVLLRAAIYFVGFSTVLTALAAALYLVDGVIYGVAFPSLYFTVLNLWIRKPYSALSA